MTHPASERPDDPVSYLILDDGPHRLLLATLAIAAVHPSAGGPTAVRITLADGSTRSASAVHGLITLAEADFAPAPWLPPGLPVDAITRQTIHAVHAWRLHRPNPPA